jgi:uncharacterized protein (TIGR02270 family)
MVATSLRQFRVDLYEEHLEDAAFLWEQSRALRGQPDIPWTYVESFEARLEAHLDALVIGGPLALDVCQRRAVEGEPGELFAGLSVVCRHGQSATFGPMLRGVDYAQPERARAVVDALKYELPDAWREPLVRAVAQSQGPLLSALARVIGYRREPQSEGITDVVHRVPEAQQVDLLWAIGRTRPLNAARAIRPLLGASHQSVREAALHAGLRTHDPEAMAEALSQSAGPLTAPLALGLCGNRSVVPGLAAAARAADAEETIVIALGLLGDLSAVRRLVDLLRVKRLARAAADALYVITGASLFADIQVPETVTEDELFDDEVGAFRETGAAPARDGGTPYRTAARLLSIDPDVWDEWLRVNADRFQAERRYRLGREYSASVLLDCLLSETLPKAYRALAAEELLIRYGIDLPFEADLPVAAQRQLLTSVAASVAASNSAFDAGRWYAFGRL